MNKKRLVILGMIATLGITGCGEKEQKNKEMASKDEKQVVTVWAWDKNFNVAIMEEAEKIYEAKNPNVDIQVIDYAREQIEQKMHTSLSSNSLNTLPDIVLIEDYTAQKFLTGYPEAFAELTDKIDYSKFAQYKVAPMTVEGKIYGVPFDSGVAAMFYRRDYMQQAGITDAELQNLTWNELFEIAKTVKEKTGKQFMSDMGLMDPAIIKIMLQSAGSWYFNEKGEANFVGNEVLKEAILTIKKYEDEGLINNANGWGEWVASMNSGEVATIFSGAWIIGSIKAETSQSGKWGVAPIPRLDNIPESVNASNSGGSSWYILNKDEKKDVATDFLKTMYAGDMDLYNKILKDRGAMGTYLPSKEAPAYKESDEFFGGQVIYSDLAEKMAEIPAVNYGVYVKEGDEALKSVLQYIVEGKLGVDEGIKRAEEQLKSQIQQ